MLGGDELGVDGVIGRHVGETVARRVLGDIDRLAVHGELVELVARIGGVADGAALTVLDRGRRVDGAVQRGGGDGIGVRLVDDRDGMVLVDVVERVVVTVLGDVDRLAVHGHAGEMVAGLGLVVDGLGDAVLRDAHRAVDDSVLDRGRDVVGLGLVGDRDGVRGRDVAERVGGRVGLRHVVAVDEYLDELVAVVGRRVRHGLGRAVLDIAARGDGAVVRIGLDIGRHLARLQDVGAATVGAAPLEIETGRLRDGDDAAEVVLLVGAVVILRRVLARMVQRAETVDLARGPLMARGRIDALHVGVRQGDALVVIIIGIRCVLRLIHVQIGEPPDGVPVADAVVEILGVAHLDVAGIIGIDHDLVESVGRALVSEGVQGQRPAGDENRHVAVCLARIAGDADGRLHRDRDRQFRAVISGDGVGDVELDVRQLLVRGCACVFGLRHDAEHGGRHLDDLILGRGRLVERDIVQIDVGQTGIDHRILRRGGVPIARVVQDIGRQDGTDRVHRGRGISRRRQDEARSDGTCRRHSERGDDRARLARHALHTNRHNMFLSSRSRLSA